MIINHNLLAENAKRQSNITENRKKKATERLSSGYKINRSADDAAGLSISEKMRGQIRGLTRASQNVQDGISFVQTGDGALEEVNSMLQRIRELAVQSSNDTNTDEDRMDIDQEVQQLKKEMTRVFNDTEFNTMPIFKAPYIPDIEGMPNDFEMYNSPDGYGVAGILINNKRYTMAELGCPNSYEHGEWEKKFYDDNGELIHLKLAADAPVFEMHRVYSYEADDKGIKINNLYATTWDTINQDGNTYSFYYHGMEISFSTDTGDTRQDVIKKFNGEGMAINSFDAIPSGISVTSSAVTHQNGTMYIYVNENNKDDISSWTYKMVADDEGIGLVQTLGSDGILHTKTKWSELSGNSSGDYPIVDWGTLGETTDEVTLASTSYGAHYMYKDNATSSNISSNLTIPIDFNVDEISKNQAKIALTYDLIGNGIDAPIRMVSATEGTQVKDYANFDSFEFQRDKLLRNFGSSGSDSPMKIEVKRTMNVVGTQTDYKQVGGEWVADNVYDVCVYSYSAVNSAGDEIMTATSGEFLNTGLSDGEITLHSSTGEQLTKLTENSNTALNVRLVDKDGYNVSLSLRYSSGIGNRDINVDIVPNGKAKRGFISPAGEAGKASETYLTTKVNPPKKLLHIQAGANADQGIDIEWTALSNSILGISGARTTTYAASQATLVMADNAIAMISDVRSTFGAYQNRLEHTRSVDQNTAENLQAAESRIRDADMAKEMMSYSQSQILNDAAMSMISQANQSTQGILSLLR